MQRSTLIDFFDDLRTARGDFLVYDDGYRSWRYTYAQVTGAAETFAERLRAAALRKGDKILIWAENRPEWIVAFWGCLLRGIVVVPIDYRASGEFVLRVRQIVGARVLLVGRDVAAPRWPDDLDIWPLEELLHETRAARANTAAAGPVPLTRDDVAEVIFTSGATAEPKGVVITHANILANIVPIEREVLKYRKWGRPFFPLRFLNLLPLSHMFGQSLATFIPPMLPGTVVFMRGYNPHDIVRQVRTRRVSVLVCVPKMLEVLRDHVLRTSRSAAHSSDAPIRWWHRWWQHRDVHRHFGWKFWCFVVGAAPLERPLEEFWSRLGYLVVQGYGLTETAPIVTLNHPFSAHKGSVGKPVPGVEVKIAPDGEILVRGENVSRGYLQQQNPESGIRSSEATLPAWQTAAAATEATISPAATENGWLHTGDIGGLDQDGRVYIRGRKKEMTVTPEGLNVFPEDVERVLLVQPGVIDTAVVGHTQDGAERVHAVLVLTPGADPQEIVRKANSQLGDHQRIRGVSVWPAAELPRTEGTRKLQRREVKAWLDAGEIARPATLATRDALAAILARFAHGQDFKDETTIEALGLSSLERVELLMALEDQFQVTVDEAAFANAGTLADLRRLVGQMAPDRGAAPGVTAPTQAGVYEAEAPAAATPRVAWRRERGGPAEVVEFPRWSRTGWARAIRGASLPTWILPLLRVFAWLKVEGREHLEGLEGPVLFAANHQSHMDAPAILAALPPRWRYRVAIAMAKEFFKAHFFPEQFGRRAWFTSSLNYYLAALFFNAFPLPQREAGTRDTLRYAGDLISEGYSILIFPEGKRTEHGEINTFRSGVGMLAAKLEVPVVPVRLIDLDKRLHHTWRMARPGPAGVRFGAPMRMRGDDYTALARQVEDAVRAL